MQLTLNNEEVGTLRNLLEGALPEIKMEAARTDLPARELRHELARRRELCERLIGQLQTVGPE
jgi:hypothetical protein